MISLRKAIDTSVEQTLETALASYRALLAILGTIGARVYPPGGERLQQQLVSVHDRISSYSTSVQIEAEEQAVEAALQSWGEGAFDYSKKQSDDLNELLSMMATVAEEMGARDERYATQFRTLADDLQATTRLHDLTSIRQSLSKSVMDIRTCVAKMANDGQDAVAQLRAQVASYQARLEEVERIASTDRLTGLANRQMIETYLERRQREGRRFSIIYLDLNGFKQVNDTLGHIAGDDLLQQFAGELRAAFRSTDFIGRWGGDEFIVIVDGDLQDADTVAGRIDRWVTGKYTVEIEATAKEVTLSCAIGVAAWAPGESITDILQRADVAMYRDKSTRKP